MRIIYHPDDAVWEILNPNETNPLEINKRDAVNIIYDITFQVMVFGCMILYSTDDYYRHLYRKRFRKYFGIVKGMTAKAERREVQQTFLVSNLSVELLYVIL